jgi:p-aminobenzoyl-glutamate transporter AbgT
MGNGVIAFLAGIAAVAWIYNKMLRKTGNNKQSSAVIAGVSGVLIFILIFIVLGFIFND